MWHTSLGNRTLSGAEAKLVGTLVGNMVDDLQLCFDLGHEGQWPDEESCDWSVAVIDRLTPHQQLAVLHDVAFYLLCPTETPPPLTAINEAAVAAIYSELRTQIEMEIDLFGDGETLGSGGADALTADDEADRCFWRTLTRDASIDGLFLEDHVDQPVAAEDDQFAFRVPPVNCADLQRWDDAIEGLLDCILWDRDFEMADAFLDAAPAPARQKRERMGIEANYFVEVAPDPLPVDVPQLIAATRQLVNPLSHNVDDA